MSIRQQRIALFCRRHGTNEFIIFKWIDQFERGIIFKPGLPEPECPLDQRGVAELTGFVASSNNINETDDEFGLRMTASVERLMRETSNRRE